MPHEERMSPKAFAVQTEKQFNKAVSKRDMREEKEEKSAKAVVVFYRVQHPYTSKRKRSGLPGAGPAKTALTQLRRPPDWAGDKKSHRRIAQSKEKQGRLPPSISTAVPARRLANAKGPQVRRHPKL